RQPSGARRRRCDGSRPGAPSSRSPTGCPRPNGPTGSWSSTPGGSSRTARTTSWSTGAASTRSSTRVGWATSAPRRPAEPLGWPAMNDYLEQLRAVAAAALFPEEGELAAPGLAEPVEVRRDAWGVPYIRAGSLDDLW